ncbi:CRP/FNR family transcriptional regulator, anaerobic regulatory protein [Humidesulfovibrio mexicanus]|uniref:CRP/FNR family transcriptional regulator, anaerobic regulatory protein n=1 Tax=Humidesulfovibrio mexicanus TaxID=147047 RepID=A0A239C6X4_9BACT|nr:Crp/Fnr family transcriptional regulator [Humidesulfovibrio mexicanus]SNS15184.1 CRP/FNR family transcriptional regulator, anaerobic regulatory protein [Humidesulfovibrio mexicanus]
MEQDKLAALARVRLFEGLPKAQLATLAEIAQLKRVAAGQILFEAGQPGTHFYAVVSGKVRIYRSAPSGKEQVLHVFGAGEAFAEVPVFEGKTYPASAQTLDDSVLLTIPRKGFVEVLRRDPELALGVMALLSARLRGFVGQIAQLSLKEVPERLAGYLLLLRAAQHTDELVLDLPKGQIAAYLGTIPETLSRAFKKLSDQGLIETSGPSVRLLDPEGLAALAEAVR